MVYQKRFQLTVSNGPSKPDLITSFLTAYAKSPNQPYWVEFETTPGQNPPLQNQTHASATGRRKYYASIRGIEHESGSGESFNIRGQLYDNPNRCAKGLVGYKFSGYYSTQTRKGALEFICEYADGKPNADHTDPTKENW